MNWINWSRIDELTQGDTTFGRELLEMFIEDARDLLSEIEKALSAGNLEVASQVAHTLKGSSGNVGAETVFGLAQNLEAQLKMGEQSTAHSLVNQIKTGLKSTEETFQTRFA
ncbi:MAG: Hpt domain-containing protein [Acidobacteria bacterium]|nr:Hpt domain-containing protein [Acidobacteriota bacterium]MCB9398281.1 Hpt domain-containing protein [Acidobacteriota bacterium]